MQEDARIRDKRNRPLEELRLSITDECNFRCTYCMPKDLFAEGHPFLPPSRLVSLEEAVRAARILVSMGVRKIKITGGEPLLRPWVVQLVRELAQIPGIEDLAMITNGFHLPRLAGPLADAGLHRLTVSVDSIDEDTFAEMTGRAGSLSQVLAGLDAAEAAGFEGTKINMVVQRGVNDSEVEQMAEYFAGRGCTMRFIEYMDVGHRHLWHPELSVASAELIERLDRRFGLVPLEPNRPGETATRFRMVRPAGEVGFISSVTQPFCGDCNRLRMAADGMLYRCLFSGIGKSMKKLLAEHDDAGATAELAKFWRLRDDNYSEMRGAEAGGSANISRAQNLQKVEMYRMGG